MSLVHAKPTFRASRSHHQFANMTAGEGRKAMRVRPGAIALRCIKTIAPVYFGRIYLGYPCAIRIDGTGTAETFMVSADGRAVRKEAGLFEPVNPRHRRLFAHLLTESEIESCRRWQQALRDKCRADEDRAFASVGLPPLPEPQASPLRDWLTANCLTGVDVIGKVYARADTLYVDYVAFVRARKIEPMDVVTFGNALDERGYGLVSDADGKRRSGICLRYQIEEGRA